MNLRAAAIIMILLSSFLSFGQQRIGLDINTTGYSLNFTATYQKVIVNRFLLNAGVIGGLLSQTSQSHQPLEIDNGLRVSSPFQSVNEPIIIDNSLYHLMNYSVSGRGLGLLAGVGYFHEFSVKHGIKFFMNGRIGISRSETLSHYHCPGNLRKPEDLLLTTHFFAAISPEINHTLRLSGRYTFSYGFKFPYHFLIDKNRFNTTNVKDGFFGLEPEFKLGLTYVIGKCDE